VFDRRRNRENDLTLAVRAAGGNLAEVAAYEAVLEQKRSEVEKRISDSQKQATDAVKSELEKQLMPKLGF